MSRGIIGIVGGMGPEATADLFLKIIRATPARCDQEHLRVIIDSNPAIPDRTACILGHGPDPLPELVATATNLERAGATLLVMPCNTAHYFHARLQAAVGIPVLHMMAETAAYIDRSWPEVRRVGVLASTGTIRSRLYDRALASTGREALVPDAPVQEQVMAAIYAVKAGQHSAARAALLPAVCALEDAGAELIIAGCTELPLILGPGDAGCPLVDPTEILARAAVERVWKPKTA
jgi:aspartate racemase